MESTQQTTLVWRTFVCLLCFIAFLNGIAANTEPEILTTDSEIVSHANHTAKLTCIIQNRNRQHVTWSRVNFVNETRKITGLLYVDLLKYTPLSRYHLTHLIGKGNQEHWNLEIRQVHPSDQGYYSCVVSATRPISKILHLKVMENSRNLSLALRSTMDVQQQGKEQLKSAALSLIPTTMFVLISLVSVLCSL